MKRFVLSCLCLALLLSAAIPLLAQEDEPQAEADTGVDTQMIAPPPATGEAYPSDVGAETRANYLAGGFSVGTAYIDNLYVGGSSGAVNEVSIILEPDIAFDQTTPRQHRNIKYTPGFTFYQPTSSLNETDQTLTGSYLYRLTPHISVNANDFFQKSATVYTTSGVTATLQPSASGVIPPLVQRISNNFTGLLTWQTSSRVTIGGSGLMMYLHFPNPSQATGLFDSNSWGGSGFISRKVSEKDFLGVAYEYLDIVAYPPGTQSRTQTNTIYPFYTRYLTHEISASISGGPQHLQISQSSAPATQSWSPAVMASMGLQTLHTSFAVGYTQAVTGGGGLLGAFHSQTANSSGQWQLSRAWAAGMAASYISNKAISSVQPNASPGGHMISGTVSLQRWLTQHLTLRGEYNRMHQSYGGIAAIASAPNTDRAMLSLGWTFSRPLGR